MLGKCIRDLSVNLQRYRVAAFFLFLTLITIVSSDALAATNASDIAVNIADSARDLPNLLFRVFAYLLGLIFGIRGVLKLKAHVENPGDGAGQTPLRTPIINFLVGGALFALPIISQAAVASISGGAVDNGGLFGTIAALVGATTGGASSGTDVSLILENITTSLSSLPGLITAFSYLLGLAIIVMGLIKVRDHVESPEQTKISEGVVRLLVGGALLTMPTIYGAMFGTIGGVGGVASSLANVFSVNFFESDYAAGGGATACSVAGVTLGSRICDVLSHTGAFPAFLTAISYLFGLVMGVWGVLKIRDHVLNPQQTTIFEGVTRLLAGGAFFALPVIVEVMKTTIDNGGFGITAIGGSGYNDSAVTGTCGSAGLGLDAVLVCFATDILGPMHSLINFFAFVAGMIFIMIGISRLVKGAQEGARGPGGIGTMMTFAMGGALVSYNEIIRAASTTFAGNATTATFAQMQYTTGMTGPERDAAHAVISSIIKFMIVVGLISFVRGLFIVRSVAEGNQQASMMAAVTHIIGGALAVNLGPVLNAVQETLGTTGYGITFSL